MKVLFATYPMAFHTPGGGEIQLLAYRKHLPAHGVDVTLFDQWKPRFLEHDLVHFFSCIGGSIHFCHFVKQLGLPLVVSSSLWITPETRHLYPVDEIRAQLALADRVVTNSDLESEALSDVLALPREKFAAVYNGIDEFFLQNADPERFRERFGVRDRFVLNVGNIEPRKNQLTLVRAMKAFPACKLILIGHQRDPAYAAQVLVEGGDQVCYIGPMEHDTTLLSAYRACEVFCLPSTLETPGLAALEAGAQGARLLLTQEGSCVEYFGRSALYVDPLSTDALRDTLGAMLGEADTREKLEPFSAKVFLWQNTVARLKDIYAQVVAERPRKRNGLA
ncbi:glycosyltransferase [Burkholderia ubonensis]|uniref:glycosyltransferase n=1 Tax=Burkholderia ubonensis TaxID=101571 RepID=UPI0008FEA49E|nr:glycosyltransferase [Burkholderia ubonensis]OJA26971.1 glycosyl transferase [Burkholderia ubonensis]